MSDSPVSAAAPNHHRSRRSWAMIACGFSADMFLVLTLLAALARSKLGSLEHASTAEGNEPDIWAYPLMVSLSLAILFATAAGFSIGLFISCSGQALHPRLTRWMWIATTAFSAVVLAPWAVAGAIMSFGSTRFRIQKACATLDSECYPCYIMFGWISIPAEICAVGATVWMLAAVKLYCTEVGISMFSSAAKSQTASAGDEERKLVGDADPEVQKMGSLARSSRRLERASAAFAGAPIALLQAQKQPFRSPPQQLTSSSRRASFGQESIPIEGQVRI
ncbi:hypothetical protein RHOSPDRAFT_32589 [Rhodotorula sp. JG-1b]|nr:hypothetical protein RHOSPDRAFT_32589 [Rhodotorula sp. JG-1b]